MKKRRPPRPKKRKAPIPQGKVENVPSSAVAPKAVISAPPIGKQLDPTVSTQAANMADRVPVSAMTNARGWGIFAGLIISFLLVASVAVLFATYWT